MEKTRKKMLSVNLLRGVAALFAVLLCATALLLPAGAAGAAQTLEERINALEVAPNPDVRELWGDEYADHIAAVTKDASTNYQRLRAVYDDVVANHSKSSNCVGYAVALECAFEALGFETYHMDGECTTVDGGWTQHKWAAIVVDGQLVYFDANIPGRYSGNPDRYFAVLPGDASWYRGAYMGKLNLNPHAKSWSLLSLQELPDSML